MTRLLTHKARTAQVAPGASALGEMRSRGHRYAGLLVAIKRCVRLAIERVRTSHWPAIAPEIRT